MSLAEEMRPLRERPYTVRERVQFAVFVAYFVTYLVVWHAIQLVTLPLLVVAPDAYATYVNANIKAGFGALITSLCALFGKTDFVLTFDDGVDVDAIVERDASGNVKGLKWAKKSIWIANHQQYGDWLYLWILMAYGNVAGGLQIILKASLRWAPIVGPAMQLFRFAFIDKSLPLQKAGIDRYARDASRSRLPYALLIFPEGTLVSRLTRPRSAQYAKTTGVADLRNTLVPRSTGLLYCLRTLLSITPELTMYDCTIGYAGVPDQGYAQDYYTLLSIFGRGLSPRQVHLHIRTIDPSGVPCGRIEPNARAAHLEQDVTDADREAFSKWTYELWREKDELMTGFYAAHAFPKGKHGEVRVPVRMRAKEWLELLAAPVVLGSLLYYFTRTAKVAIDVLHVKDLL